MPRKDKCFSRCQYLSLKKCKKNKTCYNINSGKKSGYCKLTRKYKMNKSKSKKNTRCVRNRI